MSVYPHAKPEERYKGSTRSGSSEVDSQDGWSIEQSLDGRELKLRYSVREPASAGLFATAAIAAVMRRRRRRRSLNR
jgi:hypothetical protein